MLNWVLLLFGLDPHYWPWPTLTLTFSPSPLGAWPAAGDLGADPGLGESLGRVEGQQFHWPRDGGNGGTRQQSLPQTEQVQSRTQGQSRDVEGRLRAIQVFRNNTFFCKFDTHPPPCNFFSGKSPTALRNTWMAPYLRLKCMCLCVRACLRACMLPCVHVSVCVHLRWVV